METYLQVVQRFVSEVGVAGATGPASIAISSSGIDRVVHYVADAHDYICQLWPDWRFLWVEHEGQITSDDVDNGLNVLPVPAAFRPRLYVKGSLQVKIDDAWRHIPEYEWHKFKAIARLGTERAQKDASFYTIRPDNRIELSNPVSRPFDYRIEVYRWAAPLENDEDPIVVPFPRLVLCRAKMIFAERENAPEIMHGASAEYMDLMQRLESTHLPGVAGGQGTEYLAVTP